LRDDRLHESVRDGRHPVGDAIRPDSHR
jgi:hypothetical protein